MIEGAPEDTPRPSPEIVFFFEKSGQVSETTVSVFIIREGEKYNDNSPRNNHMPY